MVIQQGFQLCSCHRLSANNDLRAGFDGIFYGFARVFVLKAEAVILVGIHIARHVIFGLRRRALCHAHCNHAVAAAD